MNLLISREGEVFRGSTAAPMRGTLSDFLAAARSGTAVNLYGGDISGGRFSTAALAAASTTLTIRALRPRLSGRVAVSYGGTDSNPFEWAKMSAEAIESAANSISGVASAGGVHVSGGNGRFIVRGREDGALTPITIVTHDNSPDLNATTTELTAGDGSTREVQMIEVAAANVQKIGAGQAQTWSAVSSPTLTATVTAGASAGHELTVIAFDLPPDGGTWTAGDGTYQTDSIPHDASAGQVQYFLNKKWGAGTWAVTKPGPFRWDCVRLVVGNQTDLTVDSTGIKAASGLTSTLSWPNLAEFAAAGADSVPVRTDLHAVFSDGQIVDVSADSNLWIEP